MLKRALVLLLLPGPVCAQSYVPFTVDEPSAKRLIEYLMDQPTKFSLPVLQWLETQQKAAAQRIEMEKRPGGGGGAGPVSGGGGGKPPEK